MERVIPPPEAPDNSVHESEVVDEIFSKDYDIDRVGTLKCKELSCFDSGLRMIHHPTCEESYQYA